MAALAVKVLSLTVKTASKPLANSFQAYMLSHPVVRTRAIEAAQYLHRWNVGLTRASEDKEGRAFVARLNEEQALKLASKFVSEAFIYATAGGLVLFEYRASQRRDDAKKRDKAQRRAEKEKKRKEAERHHADALEAMARRQSEIAERLERLEREQEGRQAHSGWGRWGGWGPQ
uniref:OPA3-like protein n=1 Tax=Chloropicon laureae TaxID=464258 RepID=A0A7S2YX96_9CHLO|mmetsp:Transcript_11842/g.30667  ORF Transcript_11842/g.30667 Transcript_11842/m.30667 type:complete len:174 (+) Transcript_11842:115-636(+)|eukprot:CAMPEP_0197489890 /NCGR_PEP_ID=MMETSP1311-20131121/4575_1 /TAXON_ID=464262 /ORGANISM="Genus nov. species nov., Strain RCC856" /LENGTH=173 /DNA_ID=CAMNT_0043034301 /DNA_START=99 /DNA_END=620 /DNA_ORIENTATION=+